ncbi:MAG TPA: squalene/phytoene synthase family protein, partial [Vicinamibacterales bacterium]|nr:squalene/phytoene synthase family protein [Vicinamibacterales bacterium]
MNTPGLPAEASAKAEGLPAEASAKAGDIEAAYAHCAAIARDHYENFPVASWLVPRRMRPHIAAIYAFARAADDF